jgi:hypothetical protein
MKQRQWLRAVQGLVVAIGLTGLASVSSLPVAAQSACQGSGGEVLVEFLGAGTSNTVLMQQQSGAYEGEVRVRVYCGLTGEVIPNAQVEIESTLPGDAVLDPTTGNWVPMSSPVAISVPAGERLITIRSSDPLLSAPNYRARVGTSTVTVVGAFGQALPGNEFPTATGMIWAQTPELGSLALFGAGAASLVGYGLTRMRAGMYGARRRDEES